MARRLLTERADVAYIGLPDISIRRLVDYGFY